MGKCVVHMQKIKGGAVRGIQSHVNREHESKTNLDIDYSRTADNYNIWACDNWKQLIDYNIRLFAQDTKTVRKDAVVLTSFIITSDEQTMKSMTAEEQKNFFKDSVDFFSNRYGSENIVSAVVHMDEKTPHLHLALTPIFNNKLCCKEMFTAKELKDLQTDFYKQVGKKYGLERGEENSKRKHKSEIDFKLEKQAEKLAQIEKQIEDLTQLKNDLQAICDSLEHKATSKGFTMADYKERIQEIRQQQAVEQKITVLEQFIQHPKIAPLWQAFVNSRQHNRTSDKER